MKRFRKSLIAACVLTALLIIAAAIFLSRPVTDGRTPKERQSIAEACLTMLRSSLTNEMDIKPDDPRVPELIHALSPNEIVITGNDVVVMRSGKPAEYHLSRRPSAPKTWILYVAGEGYFGHREIFRMEHD